MKELLLFLSVRLAITGNCSLPRFPCQLLPSEMKAFTWCSNLESITIPGSIESLGASPFFECMALSKIKVVGERKNLRLVDDVLFF